MKKQPAIYKHSPKTKKRLEGELSEEVLKVVNALEDSIDYEKPATEKVSEHIQSNSESNGSEQPATETTGEASAQEEAGAETETKSQDGQTTDSNEAGEPSVFDEINEKTKEDENIKNQVEKTAEEFTDDDFTEPDETGKAQESKEVLKIKANTQASLIEVGFQLLLCVITWEFTLENFEKWKLKTEKKRELKNAIYQVLLLERKKTSPKKQLAWLVGGIYVPLVILAVMTLFGKIKMWKEQKAQAAREAEARRKEAMARTNETAPAPGAPVIVPPVNAATEKPANEVNVKKDTRGRHKKTCPASKNKNKPCNCKV